MLKTVSLFLFITISITSIGQSKLAFIRESHNYLIHSTNLYTSTIEIEGINLSENILSIKYPVGELSELISYEIFMKKRNKWISSPLKKETSISTMSWSSFFSGTKYYTFKIQENSPFLIRIKTSNEYSIFLSKLYKIGYFESDSVHYQFSLPKNLSVSFSNDSIYSGEFEISQSNFSDSTSYYSILIHPEKEKPNDYFSNWFAKRIEPQLKLSNDIVPFELKQLDSTGNRLELAKACFKYVQQKIKYIDVENGIHAIIPRQCENTLSKGLGDCKDMATLLTSLYRHFGFEAYLGISRTNSKEGIFNFPSIGLANHSICVLKMDDEWFFLDATEDVCLFGDPSTQILGTEVFLIGRPEGYFLNIPNKTRSLSSVNIEYIINKEKYEILLQIEAKGKMNQLFYYAQLKSVNPKIYLTKILNTISDLKWTIDSLYIQNSNSIVVASSKLNTSLYSKVGSRFFYDLSFIPSPELICAIFQNSEYPLFDSSVNISLNFNGEPTTRNIPEHLTVDGQIIRGEFMLEIEDSAESFSQNTFYKKWSAFFTKPITITY